MIIILLFMLVGTWTFITWIAYDCGYDDGWNDRHDLNKGHSIRDKIAYPMANFILRHVASPWYRDALDKAIREGLAQAKKEHGVVDEEGS
jgi:hypothetical protein